MRTLLLSANALLYSLFIAQSTFAMNSPSYESQLASNEKCYDLLRRKLLADKYIIYGLEAAFKFNALYPNEASNGVFSGLYSYFYSSSSESLPKAPKTPGFSPLPSESKAKMPDLSDGFFSLPLSIKLEIFKKYSLVQLLKVIYSVQGKKSKSEREIVNLTIKALETFFQKIGQDYYKFNNIKKPDESYITKQTNHLQRALPDEALHRLTQEYEGNIEKILEITNTISSYTNTGFSEETKEFYNGFEVANMLRKYFKLCQGKIRTTVKGPSGVEEKITVNLSPLSFDEVFGTNPNVWLQNPPIEKMKPYFDYWNPLATVIKEANLTAHDSNESVILGKLGNILNSLKSYKQKSIELKVHSVIAIHIMFSSRGQLVPDGYLKFFQSLRLGEQSLLLMLAITKANVNSSSFYLDVYNPQFGITEFDFYITLTDQQMNMLNRRIKHFEDTIKVPDIVRSLKTQIAKKFPYKGKKNEIWAI